MRVREVPSLHTTDLMYVRTNTIQYKSLSQCQHYFAHINVQ